MQVAMLRRASLLAVSLGSCLGLATCGDDPADTGGKGQEAAVDAAKNGTTPATEVDAAADSSSPGAAAPGSAIHDLAAKGAGACASKTLQSVVDTAAALQPAVASIWQIYPAQPSSDGSFVFAFARTDGTFALVFKLGGGDCPAGCTENEYWYFDVDASCSPRQVGHYSAKWSTGNCLAVVGEPMWGLPAAPDPIHVCGASLGPQDVSGTFTVHGVGNAIACTAAKGSEPQVAVDKVLQMVVVQDPTDLGKGTVTITGTGSPGVDGQAIPASFVRRRFTATRTLDNLPSTCFEQSSLDIGFDFEGIVPGVLRFAEVRYLDCASGSSDYCKGLLSLTLTAK